MRRKNTTSNPGSTKANAMPASGLRVRTTVTAGKVTMQDFHFVMN